jgi:RNA polymerase sigma factor (sigma-70 family)
MNEDTVYMDKICREPLLTAVEEIQCGRAISAMMELADIPEDQLTKKQRVIKRRGSRARDRMVRGNMRLVAAYARKVHHIVDIMTFTDLCQEGALGLTRAAEKYDPSRGYKFSTYAYWWIRQAVNRSISYQERIIRLPVNLSEGIGKMSKFVDECKERENRQPTLEECASKVGVKPENLRSALAVYRGVHSTDRRPRNTSNNRDSNATLIDVLYDEDQADPLEEVGMSQSLERLQTALKGLRPDHQRLLIEYYGLDGNGGSTYLGMSEGLGVSRESVSQRIKKAERALRAAIAHTC